MPLPMEDNDGVVEPQDIFASTVDYYAAYRTQYPADLLDDLATSLGLGPTDRLLDVGCGTGQIAVPMARHCRTVIAIDPVAAMLEHARAAATDVGVANITWQLGDSRDLASLVEPGVRAAIFAASFHWTDRAEVARVLNDIITPGGSMVVTNDILDDADLPAWDTAIGAVRERYLGAPLPQLDVHLAPRHSNLEILADSPFCDIDRQIWTWERSLTVDQVVGLQFSYSFSAPAVFADRQQAFADEVRDAVLSLHPAGIVTELFKQEVLIATRPTQ